MSNTFIQIDLRDKIFGQDWLDTWRPTTVCRRRWVSWCTSRLTWSSGCRSARRTGSVTFTPPSRTSERLVGPTPVIFGVAMFCSGSDIAGILPIVQFRILPFKPVVENGLNLWYCTYTTKMMDLQAKNVSFNSGRNWTVFCHKICAWFGKFRRELGWGKI